MTSSPPVASAVPTSEPHADTVKDSQLPTTTTTTTTTSDAPSAVELTEYPSVSRNDDQEGPAPVSAHTMAIAEAIVTDTHNPNTTTTTTTQTSPPLSPTKMTRQDTEAIGPATESNAQPTAGSTALQVTLLLPSGARHPFKIDERYLKRRSIDVEEMNPLNISVYTMKELIWKDWRAEWEPRPASPAYIRLIFFGAMLDDSRALKDCRFNITAPNVVHMSVKPQETTEDEDVKHASKKGGRRRSDTDGSGSRCCVIL